MSVTDAGIYKTFDRTRTRFDSPLYEINKNKKKVDTIRNLLLSTMSLGLCLNATRLQSFKEPIRAKAKFRHVTSEK